MTAKGCCASTPSHSATYSEGNSSSRAITTSPPQSHIVLSRPSVSAHSNRHSRHHHQLATHIDKPLKLHIWRSSQLYNRHQIDRERNEFFHTRVTGRPEIWQTIRIALEVLWRGGESHEEDEGLATAQGILSAADITIPTGDLANGVYDSWGNFYSIPEYVVADPLNMAEIPVDFEEQEAGKSEIELSEDEMKRRDEKGKGVLVDLKARLSDGGGHDVVLRVGKDDSVRLVTRRIMEASGVYIY